MNFPSVKNYAPESWGQIAPLIETWAFKPLARHSSWSAPELFAFAAGRLVKTLASENASAWMMMRGDEACGFAALSTLPWDSEQVGFPAARLDYLIANGDYGEQYNIKKLLLEQLLDETLHRGVWHLSVRVDASDLSSLHVLEEAGFITVDGILTLALDLSNQKPAELPFDFNIRLATAADAEQAAALARTAYSQDRFHSDPFIYKDRADELHATWLRNSCTGKVGDAVVLAEDSAGLLGFVTCAVQRDTAARLGQLVGTIVLVASAKRARGRGVGQALTNAAIEWFREQECEVVEVGTQLRNINASRLYQKCGFRLVGSSVSLRLIL